MADRYAQLVNTPVGRLVARNTGLPRPAPLVRHAPGMPVVSGRVLLGAAPGGRLEETLTGLLATIGAQASRVPPDDATLPFKALVFDATGIADCAQLRALHAFFAPVIRRLERCGRVVVLGTPGEDCADPREATAQRALEGFTRSVGKEARRGGTAQLVLVAPGAEDQLESTLRFLLSPRSAYVSGQVVRITPSAARPDLDWERPLAGRVALVTGAARGIGAAIAATLERDGAEVVGLDAADGPSLTLDITAPDAPQAIAGHLREQHGGVDVVVHNAGITRDKTLGRMSAELWDAVLDVNLCAQERIDGALLEAGLLRRNGRLVGVSSISGIAGNAGQANYATSKAGVIGRVRSMAPVLAERAITINAVAPGFIETQMTARMPLVLREAGRRMNSMAQGGLPVDVAEAIAWLASPASAGVTGNVVRVCGQSLLGA
ncbi:MAG TPA: 3-oxoacyl-ACP reductase [Solirubrobacteraceae bacterium]|nr:3-oxoacyl-ACP reductase [Solirubrobacteraceae bacterium]